MPSTTQQVEPERRKLVVVGDGNIGKTCLLASFVSRSFSPAYIPTVFETSTATLIHPARPQQPIELQLWDTAGQEDYDRLRPLSYPGTDVILVCFGVDRAASLRHAVERWTEEVRHFCGDRPIVLVGLKSDLRVKLSSKSPTLMTTAPNNTAISTSQVAASVNKLVTVEEALEAATRCNAYQYVECSALTRQGVDEVFQVAVEAIWAYDKAKQESSKAKTKRRFLCRRADATKVNVTDGACCMQ